MPSKRTPTAKKQTKSGILKPSQRFIFSKGGKLSKTSLQSLFKDEDLWDSLNKRQQHVVLEDLMISELYGEGHPMETESDKYINYFTTENPLATRVSPDPSTGTDKVGPAVEPYFEMKGHLTKFRDHLVDGYFVPAWIAGSQAISMQRARGDYDNHWQNDPETSLSEESKAKVAAVRAKRLARVRDGLE